MSNVSNTGIIAIVVAVIAAIGAILAPLITEWYRRRQTESGKGDGQTIKYRSIVKLIHLKTGNALHSHPTDYRHSGSSGQQQVTAFGGADTNDYWIVKGPHGNQELYKDGKAVRHGDIIRLEHRNTRRNLHSHGGVPSPVTGQQEITAFGTDGIGDTNDNWRIDIENDGLWKANDRIRLIHVNTGCALHSHSAQSEFSSNQQEVTGFARRDENDFWRAEIIPND